MGTTLIKEKKRGASLKRLNTNQKMFCEEMAADISFNPTNAARKAGYKNPPQAANKLMKNSIVTAYLGKVLKERVDRCQLEAAHVLEHLKNALFLDPLELMEQGVDGSFVVKSLEDIPEHVRRCISEIKTKSYTDKSGGTETTIEIKAISKDMAMVNAMKHLGLLAVDGTNVNVHTGPVINFDELCRPPSKEDIVEARIKGE